MRPESKNLIKAEMDRPANRWLCYLLLATGIMPYFALPVLAGVFSSEFGFGSRQITFLLSVEMFGAVLAPLSAPLWIHRVPWRRAIAFSVLVAVVSNFTCTFVHGYTELLVARLIYGLGQGAMLAFAFAAIGALPDSDRAFGFGTALMTLIGAGLVVAGPEIIAVLGRNGLYLATALLTLPTLLLALAAPRANPLDRAGDAPTQGIAALLNNRSSIIFGLLTAMLFFVGMNSIWPYIELIGDAIPLEQQTIANTLGASLIFSLAGALTWAAIAGHANRSAAFYSAVFATLGSLLLIAYEPTFLSFVVGLCVYNFATTFAIPLIGGWISSMDSSGRVIVLVPAVQNLGTPLGPLAAGLAVSDGAYANAAYVGIVVYLFCILAFFSAVSLESKLQSQVAAAGP